MPAVRPSSLAPHMASREHVARALVPSVTPRKPSALPQMAAGGPTTQCCSTIWQPLTTPTPLTVPVTLMWKGVRRLCGQLRRQTCIAWNTGAPELIRDAFASVYPSAAASLDIADAGCGTGLWTIAGTVGPTALRFRLVWRHAVQGSIAQRLHRSAQGRTGRVSAG